MDHLSLRYFITVAEEMNISRAAARLYISQQSLSEHIRKLEEYYHAVFFERTPRLQMTPQGALMLAYARKVLSAEQDFHMQLTDYRTNRTRLTVGQTSHMLAFLLPEIFKKYHTLYPQILLSILTGNHEYMENMLHLGKFNIYMGLEEGSHTGRKRETLYREEIFFVISRELCRICLGNDLSPFLAKNRKGITLNDVMPFPITIAPSGHSLRKVFNTRLTELGAIPNIVLETNNQAMMLQICKAGISGCFISKDVIYQQIIEKTLPDSILYFPLIDLTGLSSYEIVYTEKTLTEYEVAFIECAKNTIADLVQKMDESLHHGGTFQ